MATHTLRRRSLRWILIGSAWWLWASSPVTAQNNPPAPSSIIHTVRTGEKREMVVNTSQILTLGLPIPQVQVHNPDLVTATLLSPTLLRVSARKTGVTQINIWDEKGEVYTIDVVIVGDARELKMLLNSEFPGASINVRPVGNGALISGFVDRPEDVERIKVLAEEFYPKVIMNITVGGVQQIQLHMRVYEVSRSKIRTMGFDFAQISSGNLNTLVRSGISGLLSTINDQGQLPISTNSTFQFGIVSGGSVFLGVLEALCQSDVARIVTEPRLTAISGRPSYFNVGGELPYSVSQGLGAVSIEWKNYGTRIDYVPIVLGHGRVRLELKPRVSEIDKTQSLVQGIPAIKKSDADTAVELEVGQTLAIAGFVQTRIEAQTRGFPWLSDLPLAGALFRRVHEEKNEIETLILVTPEFVDAMDPHEVPPCPPGSRSQSPSDWQLFMEGHIEVPNRCPPCTGPSCPQNRMPGDPQPGESAPQYPVGTPAAGPQTTPSSSGGAGSVRTGRPATTPGTDRRLVAPAAGGPQRPTEGRGGLPGFGGPIGYDLTE